MTWRTFRTMVAMTAAWALLVAVVLAVLERTHP